jgi:hypothetical protein
MFFKYIKRNIKTIYCIFTSLFFPDVSDVKFQKKEEKINKFAKKHDEELKERVEKIQSTKDKWTTRVETHHNHLKTEENSWFKKGKEKQLEILQYLEMKRKRDLLKHSESMQNSTLQKEGTEGSPSPTKNLGATWN